jgi:hypothetical protein
MANRIAIGQVSSGVYGIKISKPGYDVLTAADENLLLDTNSNFSRVLQMGQLVFNAGGSITQSATLPSLGGSSPCVIFRYVEVFEGAAYAFPLYRNESNTTATTTNTSNGWTATAVGTSVSVTRNFSSTSTQYVYYFAIALPI